MPQEPIEVFTFAYDLASQLRLLGIIQAGLVLALVAVFFWLMAEAGD